MDLLDTEILTLGDGGESPPDPAETRACKLLRLESHLRPGDLRDACTVVFRQRLDVIATTKTEQSCDGALLLVSSDYNSDLNVPLSVFPWKPGLKTLPLIPDRETGEPCIVRLSLNVVAIPLVIPMDKLLPLNPYPENSMTDTRNPVAQTSPANIAIVASENESSLYLDIQVKNVNWQEVDSKILGYLCAEFTISVPNLCEEGRKSRFSFGRLLGCSAGDVRVSGFVAAPNSLTVSLIHCRAIADVASIAPSDLGLRLELLNVTALGPYFSNTGLPCLRTSPDDPVCVELVTPHDLVASPMTPCTLKVRRKFYGNYLGLFVPEHNPELHVTASIWHPETWLEVVILSKSQNVVVRAGETLGRIYFTCHGHQINEARTCQFSDDIKSRVLESRRRHILSVLGLRIGLRTLPDMVVTGDNSQINDLTVIAVGP